MVSLHPDMAAIVASVAEGQNPSLVVRDRLPDQLGRARKIQQLTLTLLVALMVAGSSSWPGYAAEDTSLLTGWLNAQTNFQTWSADFTQTRSLKTLSQPLTAPGRIWFAAPNRFRWELGNPPQTIAIRQPDQMLLIYPRLKRAERYSLGAAAAGPWKDALALLEAGFPRQPADLESRFRILSLETSNGTCAVTLQPKAAAARRMMPQIQIAFGTNDFSLRATELTFADGSRMRNDFTNALSNPKLDDAVFQPKLGPDVRVTDPMVKAQP